MMALAVVILRTRKLRRRLILQVGLTVLIFIVLGLWPLAGFLQNHPLIFGIFWLICFVALIALFLLTIYDLVRTPREILDQAAREEQKLKDEFLKNQPYPAAAEHPDEDENDDENR